MIDWEMYEWTRHHHKVRLDYVQEGFQAFQQKRHQRPPLLTPTTYVWNYTHRLRMFNPTHALTNMSSYYPLGIPTAVSQSLFSMLAVTSSFAVSSSTLVPQAVYAISIQSPGVQGPPGAAKDIGTCPSAPQGPQGIQGPSGSQGTNITTCPSGSKQCTSLAVTGYTVVCIQIPAGYTSADTPCPPSL